MNYFWNSHQKIIIAFLTMFKSRRSRKKKFDEQFLTPAEEKECDLLVEAYKKEEQEKKDIMIDKKRKRRQQVDKMGLLYKELGFEGTELKIMKARYCGLLRYNSMTKKQKLTFDLYNSVRKELKERWAPYQFTK